MSETYHFHDASAQLAFPEKAVFRVGGSYLTKGGLVATIMKAEGDFMMGHTEGGAAGRQTWRGDGAYWSGPGRIEAMSLLHCEMAKRDGRWAPIGFTPATIGPFGSGATLQTDGSKIVGRTQPDAEAAQKSRDVRPRTAREAIFAINVAMHEAWDAAAQSAKSSPHPSPFAAKTLFRSPDISGTSHLHGSAHLLPKG